MIIKFSNIPLSNPRAYSILFRQDSNSRDDVELLKSSVVRHQSISYVNVSNV